MVTILTIDIKSATFFLSAHQLLFHLSDLSSSQTFLLPPSVTFFYCTCYCCMLSDMHYNNEKSDEYRLSGTLSLLCVLCFNCALFLLCFVDNTRAGVNYQPF